MVLLLERAGSRPLYHVAAIVDSHTTGRKIHRCGVRHAVVWGGLCADVCVVSLPLSLHRAWTAENFLSCHGPGCNLARRRRLGRSPKSRLYRRLCGRGVQRDRCLCYSGLPSQTERSPASDGRFRGETHLGRLSYGRDSFPRAAAFARSSVARGRGCRNRLSRRALLAPNFFK